MVITASCIWIFVIITRLSHSLFRSPLNEVTNVHYLLYFQVLSTRWSISFISISVYTTPIFCYPPRILIKFLSVESSHSHTFTYFLILWTPSLILNSFEHIILLIVVPKNNCSPLKCLTILPVPNIRNTTSMTRDYVRLHGAIFLF